MMSYDGYRFIGNLIFDVIMVIVAIPLIVNPQKVTERPKCKIKNPAIIRGLGILICIIIIVSLINNYFL